MEITCPVCSRRLEFEQALDAAFSWGGLEPVVAFRCVHCGQPAYFGPRATFLEVGFIGAGPPIDPVPMDRYPIIVGVERDGQYLTLEHGGNRRTIPSVNIYLRDGAQ
jgi:hypothetical protein